VARFGENRNAHQLLVVKPERKRSLVRPRCRWRILLKCVMGDHISENVRDGACGTFRGEQKCAPAFGRKT